MSFKMLSKKNIYLKVQFSVTGFLSLQRKKKYKENWFSFRYILDEYLFDKYA